MRSSVPTSGSDPSNATSRAPIYLNVYDVINLNNYLYWLGLGIFHSAIEVHGVEYAFGAHDYSASGVFEVEPRNCPGFTFRRAISLGTTDKNPSEFREFIDEVARGYAGDSYHLISKNCNHFTNDVCIKLTKAPMPGWVNRLANMGKEPFVVVCYQRVCKSQQFNILLNTTNMKMGKRLWQEKNKWTLMLRISICWQLQMVMLSP